MDVRLGLDVQVLRICTQTFLSAKRAKECTQKLQKIQNTLLIDFHSSRRHSTGLTREAFSACIPTVIHEISRAIVPDAMKNHAASGILYAKSSSQSLVRK